MAKKPASPSTSAHVSPQLQELERLSEELLKQWAEDNKNTLWLGAKSREAMRTDVLKYMKKAYLLAKDKYKKD